MQPSHFFPPSSLTEDKPSPGSTGFLATPPEGSSRSADYGKVFLCSDTMFCRVSPDRVETSDSNPKVRSFEIHWGQKHWHGWSDHLGGGGVWSRDPLKVECFLAPRFELEERKWRCSEAALRHHIERRKFEKKVGIFWEWSPNFTRDVEILREKIILVWELIHV